ncbi:MAG: MFS transporter [Coriobacteriia bacterium]|nr:MFS transporter [Coriobacteriia bacterium]
MPSRMDKREWSWVLYDVGNSAFVMLSTAIAPIYFGSLLSEGSSVVVGWGYAETIVSLIVALLMPLLGSLADFRGAKKRFFIGSAGTGIVACSALSLATASYSFLIVYIIAAVGLNTSMVFYDGFLIDATTEENYDSVSAKGFAWGYIGSLVPFLTCIALIFNAEGLGLSTVFATRLSFVITALWWAGFTVPLLRNVQQTHFKERVGSVFSQTFAGLGATVRSIAANRGLRYFMLAFFCYIDGVHTIIKMATSFGTDLGIDSTQLVLALVVTQLVAFPAALVYGRLARSVPSRSMLMVSSAAYAIITLYAAFFLASAREFWILAVAVGLFQGGIQALSRSYFGKLIPDKSHANEYYGFFDILGKYAAIIGTLLMSVFTQLTGNTSIGILSITTLFVLGIVFLALMPKEANDVMALKEDLKGQS